MSAAPHALMVAGGTGGHIFPALAVAHALKAAGWTVSWMGNPQSMEGRLVPSHGFELQSLQFAGVRGKGLGAKLSLPWRLSRAILAARGSLQRLHPSVVLGFGGYLTAPAGLAARSLGIPVLLHEQNAIAGSANRLLRPWAQAVLTGFPSSFGPGRASEWVGNPVREDLLAMQEPQVRLSGREGPLRLLIIGGSLGAEALNQVLPLALAEVPVEQRPEVWHQTGEAHLAAVEQRYAHAGVQARCTAFVRDMQQAYAWADLLVCRAGAMTVSEVAAVGLPALFVPLPHAIDDHQTHNARWLTEHEAGWLLPQSQLTPVVLANWLCARNRDELIATAQRARQIAPREATQRIVARTLSLLEPRS